jgi:hypothetical protein
MTTTNHTSPIGEDAANGAVGEREAFELWHADPQRKVYVGDKASAYKGWQAHAARTAEPVATTVNLIIRDVCESEPGDINHVDTLCIGVEYLRDILERRLERAALTAGKAAQAEPVLDKPAKVGGGRFGVGVKWSTVIGAAQRHYEYEVTPEKEAARIARAGEVIESIRRGEYLSEPAQPDRCYAPSCGMWDGNDSCTCQRVAPPAQTQMALTDEQREAFKSAIAGLHVLGWTHRVPILQAFLTAAQPASGDGE